MNILKNNVKSNNTKEYENDINLHEHVDELKELIIDTCGLNEHTFEIFKCIKYKLNDYIDEFLQLCTTDEYIYMLYNTLDLIKYCNTSNYVDRCKTKKYKLKILLSKEIDDDIYLKYYNILVYEPSEDFIESLIKINWYNLYKFRIKYRTKKLHKIACKINCFSTIVQI